MARWCYHYLGYGYIHFHMLRFRQSGRPPLRKPSNFALWVITVYSALFSLAFQRHENGLNRLYLSFSSYVSLLGNDLSLSTVQGFVNLQSYEIPVEPSFINPFSVFRSFLDKEPYPPVVSEVGDLVSNPINRLLQSSKEKISIRGLKSGRRPLKINGVFYKTLHLEDFELGHVVLEKGSFAIELSSGSIEQLHINDSRVALQQTDLEVDRLHIANSFLHSNAPQTVTIPLSGAKREVNDSTLMAREIYGHNSYAYDLRLKADRISKPSVSGWNSVSFYRCTFEKKPSIPKTLFGKPGWESRSVSFKACVIEDEPYDNASEHFLPMMPDSLKVIIDLLERTPTLGNFQEINKYQ